MHNKQLRLIGEHRLGSERIMGWIRERILAEHSKHYRVTGGLDWAKLAEQKIKGNLIEEIKQMKSIMWVGMTSKVDGVEEPNLQEYTEKVSDFACDMIIDSLNKSTNDTVSEVLE